MTITHDTATTWRDLADLLTPQQIADLEGMERRRVSDSSAVDYREWLVGEARDYIADNKRDAELSARIQPPAAATTVEGWNSIEYKTGRQCRSIQWAAYDAGPTSVDIDGWQDDTGAVDGPHLSVYGLEGDGKLSAADARRLAETLIIAATKLDQINS